MLTHWFRRYILVLQPYFNSYFLLDVSLQKCSFPYFSIKSALRFEDLNEPITLGISNTLKNILIKPSNYKILAESDYPITEKTHPELFL